MGNLFSFAKRLPSVDDTADATSALVRNTGRAMFHPSVDTRPVEEQPIYPNSAGPAPTPGTPAPPEAWYRSYGRYAPPAPVLNKQRGII